MLPYNIHLKPPISTRAESRSTKGIQDYIRAKKTEHLDILFLMH